MAGMGNGLDFSGRTALVTGSTSGIGLAIVRQLACAGARVIVHGRGPERVSAVVEELGRKAHGIACDLSTPEGVGAIVTQVRALGARPDILVLNAGQIVGNDVLSVTAEEIDRCMWVNAWSGLALVQAFADDMLALNDNGRVVWISSDAGVMPQAEMTAYGLSKQAQIFLARAFAEAAARAGADTVASTTVVVGPTVTPGADRYLRDTFGSTDVGESWQKVMDAHPYSLLRRPTTADEVASVVVWLASPYSTGVRGSVIRVEGGAIPAPL